MPRKVSLSEDQVAQLLRMAELGGTISKIADELDISETTVRRTLTAYGVKTRRQHTLKDEVDMDTVIKQYQEWVEIDDIMEQHGLNHSQLYYLLRQHGITARTKDDAWREAQAMRMDHAVEMYEEGETLAQIKEETGIHQPQLHEELHRRKIPLRRPHPRTMPSDEEILARISEVRQERKEQTSDPTE